MQPERRYAATVAAGLVAFAACAALGSPWSVTGAAGAVYAATGYYATVHADIFLRSRRRGPANAALTAATVLGFVVAFLSIDDSGLAILVFGLVYLGFATGVDATRRHAEPE